jgi:serine protease Do
MVCHPRPLSWLLAAVLSAFLVPQGATSAQEPDIQELEEQAIKAATGFAAAAVVRIETFGGLEKVGRLLVGTGPTTGLVVHGDGYVISSAFNFVQQPSSILVTLPSGKRAAAQIVARDHSRMLVLLKVNSDEKLAEPQSVPLDEITVGQWAIALGRTVEGGGINASVGIVSATDRIWGKALQTDAKVSPSNYGGPLVDIHGRVLGVLVPMSPQGQGEVAGAEWYDSGIGFAVPLVSILSKLEPLKRGEDLHAGIMGITLQPGDMYARPAVIAASQPNSPAANAGLKAGDTIVEIDGVKIERQAQLRHELGRRYAGDKVRVVAVRETKRIEVEVELVARLEPYEHPFLGILPLRDGKEVEGVGVRYVYPGSPADEAGIRPGDRITALAGKPVADRGAMQEEIASFQPGTKVAVERRRGEQKEMTEVTLSRLPVDIPADLPAARMPRPAPAGERPAVGVVDIKLPEERNECAAYVPDDYDPEVAHGVVVWLHAPGGFNKDRLVERWKELCRRHDLILLAPKSADPARWEPTEVDFVEKVLANVMATYNVDRSRVVAHGYQGGGAMAYLVAFAQRETFRGVAAVDAPVPQRAGAPAGDPIHRLAFYTAAAEKSALSEAILAGVKRLKDLKFPVTEHKLGEQPRDLADAERAELARWIDTLDRI